MGTSPPYDEVASATEDRGVTDIAIFGYSQGGGATQVLADWMASDGFDVGVTAYVDAIDHDGAFAENERPDSDYHLNIYETIDWLLPGGPTNNLRATDREIDVTNAAGWEHTLDHLHIDDDAQVQSEVRDWLGQHLDR